MKLENQVCTLEQAKQLSELGISQNSEYHFVDEVHLVNKGWVHSWGYEETWEDRIVEIVENDSREKERIFSAFTVAELGMLLPCFFPSFVQEGHFHCHCQNERVDTFPLISGNTEFDNTPAHILNKELVPFQTGKTEAQARANMLIYLIENNLVTADECNERLLN